MNHKHIDETIVIGLILAFIFALVSGGAAWLCDALRLQMHPMLFGIIVGAAFTIAAYVVMSAITQPTGDDNGGPNVPFVSASHAGSRGSGAVSGMNSMPTQVQLVLNCESVQSIQSAIEMLRTLQAQAGQQWQTQAAMA